MDELSMTPQRDALLHADLRGTAIKALADRDSPERKLARAQAKLFKEFGAASFDALEKVGWNAADLPAEFWAGITQKEKALLLPYLEELSLISADALMLEMGVGVEWGLVNTAAAEWARSYSAILAGQIEQSSRKAIADGVRNSIAAFFEDGLTFGELQQRLKQDKVLRGLFTNDVKDKLGRVYGPRRAAMIARTEVTRAAAQGELMLVNQYKQDGIQMRQFWLTRLDELMCEICKPRHEIEQGKGEGAAYWQDPPPAHVNCRCGIRHEMVVK